MKRVLMCKLNCDVKAFFFQNGGQTLLFNMILCALFFRKHDQRMRSSLFCTPSMPLDCTFPLLLFFLPPSSVLLSSSFSSVGRRKRHHHSFNGFFLDQALLPTTHLAAQGLTSLPKGRVNKTKVVYEHGWERKLIQKNRGGACFAVNSSRYSFMDFLCLHSSSPPIIIILLLCRHASIIRHWGLCFLCTSSQSPAYIDKKQAKHEMWGKHSCFNSQSRLFVPSTLSVAFPCIGFATWHVSPETFKAKGQPPSSVCSFPFCCQPDLSFFRQSSCLLYPCCMIHVSATDSYFRVGYPFFHLSSSCSFPLGVLLRRRRQSNRGYVFVFVFSAQDFAARSSVLKEERFRRSYSCVVRQWETGMHDALFSLHASTSFFCGETEVLETLTPMTYFATKYSSFCWKIMCTLGCSKSCHPF